MTPFTVRQPLHCHAARLGRCVDAHRTSVRHPAPCASVPPDPTQLPAKGAFFVVAITQRAQCPSYPPFSRSYCIGGRSTFLRNPQPRSRGAFFAPLDFLRRERKKPRRRAGLK